MQGAHPPELRTTSFPSRLLPGPQECLPTSLLQCAASDGGTGCSRCRRGSKMVTATRAPAAYSLASRPQQGGFCREPAESRPPSESFVSWAPPLAGF